MLLPALFALAVISADCGREKTTGGPEGTGGATAVDGMTAAGGVGAGGGGGSGGSLGSLGSGDAGAPVDAASPGGCPPLVQHGSRCVGDATTTCPGSACQECIGGYWRMTAASNLPCYCLEGAWWCPAIGGVNPVTTMSDCAHGEPMTCEEAKVLYTDAACTQHPPCHP